MVVVPDEERPLRLEPGELLASLGQAVITTDVDGRVVYWNKAAETLYGWSEDEAVGRNIAELTVPEMARGVAEEIMAALRDGTPWSGGFPVRRKDGTVFPALVTDSGVYRDGTLVAIVGVSTNLGTALRPLLERSTDAELVLRNDGVITYASPAVTRLFGWQEETVTGCSILPLLHVEDRPALARYLGEVAAVPGPHPPVELRVAHGGGWTWAEAVFTNLLDDPGVRGLVCNVRPSPRRTAQEEAEKRARQLQTALDSRVVIEQAKGFLAARAGIDPEAAFTVLRSYARSHSLSVRVVSRRIVDGDLVLPQ